MLDHLEIGEKLIDDFIIRDWGLQNIAEDFLSTVFFYDTKDYKNTLLVKD